MNALRNPFDPPSPRIQRLARLPVFFSLFGKRAVVAGGDAAAAWKAELLSAAGAAVEVYACEPCEELQALAANPPAGAITVHLRNWESNDLAGAAMAVGACADDDAAAAFAVAARKAGVPVNVIDKPVFCDFSFGAIVNRSPLVIGISTDGAAPAFAQAVRARIEAILPSGFALWVAAAARWRAKLKASELSFGSRRRFWRLFAALATSRANRPPTESDFVQLVDQVEALGSRVEAGSVTTVTLPSNDPDQLTLRAVRALQTADVIVFDNAVVPETLEFARREADRIAVRVGEDISSQMIDLARSGKRVVRLSLAGPGDTPTAVRRRGSSGVEPAHPRRALAGMARQPCSDVEH